MKVLVTGASGFLGRALVRRLSDEHETYSVVRDPAAADARSVVLDLSASLDLSRLPKTIDAVVHLAQSRHFRRFPEQAPDIFGVNVASTAQLLHWARAAGARVFVFASSGGVVAAKQGEIQEDDPSGPSNFYLLSKDLGERLVRSYADFFTTVVLRYFFIYGAGQRGMFIPNLVTRVATSEPVTLQGENGISVNPVHVDDAAEATARVLSRTAHDIINIAGPDTTTIRGLAKEIGAALGVAPNFTQERAAPGYVASIAHMREALGFVPRMSLPQGLAQVVQEFVSLGRRW